MLPDCVVGADVSGGCCGMCYQMRLRYFGVYRERREEISEEATLSRAKAWLPSLFIIDVPAMQEL